MLFSKTILYFSVFFSVLPFPLSFDYVETIKFKNSLMYILKSQKHVCVQNENSVGQTILL